MDSRPLSDPEMWAKYEERRDKAFAFLKWFGFLTMIGICLLLIVSCSSIQASRNTQAETKVFAASADYNVMLLLATKYETQPRCVGVSRPTCSDIKIVAVLRKADLSASAVLKAAEDTVRTPGATDTATKLAVTAAVNAVGALKEILLVNGILK